MSSPVLLPRRVHLRSRPDVTLLRPCLALTLYLEPGPRWASEWASHLFQAFLEHAPAGQLRWFRSSIEERWRPVGDLSTLAEALSFGGAWRDGGERHLLKVVVRDDQDLPETCFSYREVARGRTPRVGFAELRLPFDRDPDALLALAIEAAHRFPVACGVGGYAFALDPRHPRNAGHAAWRESKRFLGVDLLAPESFSLFADEALPGTGWLTLIGATGARAGVDVDRLATRVWRNDVATMSLPHALLLRAGARPHTGDVNLMDLPLAQAEVSAALAPHLATKVTLPGRFREEEATRDWILRHVEPETWS